MITLEEFAELLEPTDRIRIIKGNKEAFIGWLDILKGYTEIYKDLKSDQVREFRAVPELRHKNWEELGLLSPIEPYTPAEFSFSDMQMKLYYTIYLQDEDSEEEVK